MAEIFDILTLDVDKNADILMTDVYLEIANVTMAAPSIAGAWYETGISITSTFDQTTKSKFIRFSTDNGATWNEFITEPKDKTDADPTYYAYPHQFATEAAHTLIVQARKEDATGVMTVNFADAWIKRIG